MTAGLGEAGRERMRRRGIDPLSDEQGLAFLDAALVSAGTPALAVKVESGSLRALAAAGALPPVLSGLVSGRPERRRASASLAAKLASIPEQQRGAAALELVRAEAAAVLGHASAEGVPVDRSFNGARLRLARRGRAAQPPRHDQRRAPAGDGRLRSPHGGRPGRVRPDLDGARRRAQAGARVRRARDPRSARLTAPGPAAQRRPDRPPAATCQSRCLSRTRTRRGR